MSEPRVAIVTGAGRGIGAATVAALTADGRRVLAVDLGSDDPRLPYALATAAELDAVVAAANDTAGEERARAARADATDPAAMAAVVADAEAWGGVEAIVANAGVIAGGHPAWEVPQDQEDAVVEACLRSVMVTAGSGSRPSSAAPSLAPAASSPPPRRPPSVVCPASPPTAPPRPASPATSAPSPSTSAEPASPPTPSPPAPPTPRCWPRVPAYTTSPTPGPSPPNSRSSA